MYYNPQTNRFLNLGSIKAKFGDVDSDTIKRLGFYPYVDTFNDGTYGDSMIDNINQLFSI